MLTLKRIVGIAAAAAIALALGLYWLLAHAAIANMDDQPVGYVAPLDMNNYDLTSSAGVAYRGDFFPGTWDGDLVAHSISSTGNTTVTWQARDRLASQAWDTGRKIFTMGVNAEGIPAGIPFTWTTPTFTTSLTTTQQTALGGTTTGPDLVAFTRGSDALEGKAFRERFSKLGDIIHSRPYYVKHSSTVGRVYVGANDGMLHAFDAANGNEVFAYIPSMLIPKLSQLAVNPYINHKYGVDGLIAVSTFVQSSATMTLLVSGLGAGDKGIFALDITNPSPATEAAAATMAKWERTELSTDFANLGHVYGTPVIAKLNYLGTRAVLVPNGINSTSGRASLFVIDALTGEKLAEIVVDSSTADNGLTGIAAGDLNGDGTVDIVYAGDLAGKIWKIDFSSKLAYPSTATAVFTPESGTARPIMAAPAISLHPSGGILVNFGTGKILETADVTATGTDYLYGVWDSTRVSITATFAEPVLSTAYTTGTTPRKYRTASTVPVNYGNGARGWRITLPAGERVPGGTTLVDSGRFVVTTSVPDASVTATYGAWLMEVNALTGAGPATPFFDLNGDKVLDLAGNTDKVFTTVGGANVYSAPAGKFLGLGVASQPILAKISKSFDQPYFNFNENSLLPSVPTTTSSTSSIAGGVSNGHFDFDIYYGVCKPLGGDYKGSCNKKHVHEYDDKFNAVGVNLLNASENEFNLVKAVPSTSTQFKLLVANANWSPAAVLTIGKISKTFRDWPLSPEKFVASTAGGTATTLTRASLGALGSMTFVYSLPLNAFKSQEWVSGSGDIRAGLHPSETGCVQANDGAQGAATGPWMNGALTIQVVAANTPASAVELSQTGVVAGGYRLKKDATSQAYQLAQYTTFWHHPNKKCFGEAGWTQAPPQDTSAPGKPETPDAGAKDPKGNFAGTSGAIIGGEGSTFTTCNGVKCHVDVSYDAVNDQYVISRIQDSDGSVIDQVFVKDKPADGLKEVELQQASRVRLGRLSWKEVVR